MTLVCHVTHEKYYDDEKIDSTDALRLIGNVIVTCPFMIL